MAAILRTHALKRIWAVTIMFNWLTTLQEQQLKSIHLPQAVHFTHRGFRSVCRGVVEGRPLQENWDKNQLLLDLNLVFTSPGYPENYYWSPSSRPPHPKVMQNCIEGFFSYSFQGQKKTKKCNSSLQEEYGGPCIRLGAFTNCVLTESGVRNED